MTTRVTSDGIIPLLDRKQVPPLYLTTPNIPSPENFAITMARVLGKTYENSQMSAKNIFALSQNIAQGISDTIPTETQHIEDNAKALASLSLWQQLSDLAEYILNSISVVVGISLMGTSAPVIGGTLIGFGVLGIFNKVMVRMELWESLACLLTSDPEMKKTVATLLPTAIGIACMIANAAGTGFLWVAGTAALPTAVMFANTLANIIAAICRMGFSLSRASSEIQKAKLTLIQDQNALSLEEMNLLQECAKESLACSKEISAKWHFLGKTHCDTIAIAMRP